MRFREMPILPPTRVVTFSHDQDPKLPQSRLLFHFNVRRPDHVAPFLGFFGDDFTKVSVRACGRRGTQIRELCFDAGIDKGRIDCVVQLFRAAADMTGARDARP
jgi:hypothetical protein